jgi:hypothetical protein
LRLMSDLLTHPPVPRALPAANAAGDAVGDEKAYQLVSDRRSTVSVRDLSGFLNLDRQLARYLIFESPGGPAEMCRSNIAIARNSGRLDYSRLFSIMEPLFKTAPPHGKMSMLVNQATMKLWVFTDSIKKVR